MFSILVLNVSMLWGPKHQVTREFAVGVQVAVFLIFLSTCLYLKQQSIALIKATICDKYETFVNIYI